jgi:hypothetical protein
MAIAVNNELSQALLTAIHSKAPSQGFTHTFYKYPARFSPEFARTAIDIFSEAGDVVLDPFMGSGTTLVEAMVAGRHSIGSDINSLAKFVADAKTTILKGSDIDIILRWSEQAIPELNIWNPVERHQVWEERGYQKYLPWRVRKLIELALNQLPKLPTMQQRNFVRCCLLRTAQWALDCTKTFPSASEFRSRFSDHLTEHIGGITQLKGAVDSWPANERPRAICFNHSAEQLNAEQWHEQITKKPTLVVTSPPYPNVRVLYHRWQIKGRRQTAAPYWIAHQLDGHGETFYTMGSYTPTGVNNYFRTIQSSFTHIHRLLGKGAIVIQLIAFSNIVEHLPRYLDVMRSAGYDEMNVCAEGEDAGERVWRQVPLRKWYASLKGNLSSSREFLLVHQKVG